MNYLLPLEIRYSKIIAFCLLTFYLSGCAVTPDNWAFQKEVIKTDELNQIKRIALLDVPPPSNIVLGDQFSDSATGFFGLVGMFTVEDTEGRKITSGTLVSETTQNELKKWLEQAGIEVIQVKAERKNKSKMLKSYEQFSQVDADAILEVAPVSVGFKYNLYEFEFRKSKRDLSPDFFYKYRLVSTKTGEILVESNVTYSSFYNYHGLVKVGIKLKGPDEHILDDEDFVKENPEEAVRRLKHAISGATESIAQVVTNTRPSISFIKPSGIMDLTGVYRVRIRREDIQSYSCWGGKRSFVIRLEQKKSNQAGTYGSIEGAFLSGLGGRIKGTLYNNRVKYSFTTKHCDWLLYGAWELKPDGLSLEGYGWKAVKWKLNKL